jgi:hypothetical protein
MALPQYGGAGMGDSKCRIEHFFTEVTPLLIIYVFTSFIMPYSFSNTGLLMVEFNCMEKVVWAHRCGGAT